MFRSFQAANRDLEDEADDLEGLGGGVGSGGADHLVEVDDEGAADAKVSDTAAWGASTSLGPRVGDKRENDQRSGESGEPYGGREEEDCEGSANRTLEASLDRQRRKRPRISREEKVLVVGVACVDIIDVMDAFPVEDQEYRSKNRLRRLGGNGANLVRVASQFDQVQCSLVYATASESVDPTATFVRDLLQKSNVVDLGVLTGGVAGMVPSSFIIQCPSTRTILHYRGLPEVSFEDFDSVHIPFAYTWTHFEARDVGETRKMMEHVSGSCTVSLEVEKERRGDVVSLAQLADVVIFSRVFVEGRGKSSAEEFLTDLARNGKLRENAKIAVAWGESGAFGMAFPGASRCDEARIFHVPARQCAKVVDTIGAGDTFNAGLLVGLLRGESFEAAMRFACDVAGRKCEQDGFDGLGSDAGA